MRCRFCGKELSDTANFCDNCGRVVTQSNGNANGVVTSYNAGRPAFPYVIGVLFLIGGVLPYLIRQDMVEYNAYLSSFYQSAAVMAAISTLRSFITVTSLLFYFSSSAFSVFCGILFFKTGANLRRNIMACMISHLASLLYSGSVALSIIIFPQSVVSLFIQAPDVSAAAASIMRSEPGLLYVYWNAMLYRAVISVALVAASAAFLYNDKKGQTAGETGRSEYQTVGIAVMIPVLALFGFSQLVIQSRLLDYFGDVAVAAGVAANLAFVSNYGTICVFLMFSFMIISVVFSKTKKWLISLPVIGVVVILGIKASFSALVILNDYAVMPDVLQLSVTIFRRLAFSSAAMLIAVFLWFVSVARNKIPVWLQILLPVSLPVIYYILETAGASMLNFIPGFIGLCGISLLMITVSELDDIRKIKIYKKSDGS